MLQTQHTKNRQTPIRTANDHNQFAMSAKRRNLILEALAGSEAPLTIEQLYEKPEIKALSKGKYNVNDDLKSMRGKEVVKVPSHLSTHRYAYTIKEVQQPGAIKMSGEARGAFPRLTKKQNDIDFSASNIERRKAEAVNKEAFQSSITVIKMFLNDEQYEGFLKGSLIAFPEHKETLLQLMQKEVAHG